MTPLSLCLQGAIAELRVRGDPHVSSLHCLEEDDEDSGGVSVGSLPTPPTPTRGHMGARNHSVVDWKGLL